jgi:hypothetical protein
MELLQPAASWRVAQYLNVTRDLMAAMLVRTPVLWSPRSLRPSQIVSPMSDEWLREFESFDAVHGYDGR